MRKKRVEFMAERRIIQGFLETWYGLLRGVRQKSRCSHWRILFNWAIPVIFMVPLQAAGEGPEDSLESRIWSLVASYRFNDAMKEFRQLEKSDDERVSRRARYGSAITLLSVIPKTVGNIERAEELFRALSEGPGDAITVRSVYYLGRIKSLHQRNPDWEAAAQFYWRMIREWPKDPFTQLAIVKLATIRLYEPTSREEKVRRYDELKSLERLLNFPAARRDYHYTLGVASLSLGISKEQALRHLIACVDAGITTPRMRINTYCRIAVTAKQLGKFDLARDYFKRFLREAPRDLRKQMIQDHLEEMAVMSASASSETGSQ